MHVLLNKIYLIEWKVNVNRFNRTTMKHKNIYIYIYIYIHCSLQRKSHQCVLIATVLFSYTAQSLMSYRANPHK